MYVDVIVYILFIFHMLGPSGINRQFICRLCIAGVVSKELYKSEVIQHMLSFHSEKMLSFRSISSLESHSLSAVRDCLFSKFALSSVSRVRILPPQRSTLHALATWLWWRDPRNWDHLEDINIDGRIIFGWIFTK